MAADFNGDGVPDLAIADEYNAVDLLLGNGDGTFKPAMVYPTAGSAQFIAAGDFNEDGKLYDIAIAVPAIIPGPKIEILLGNGDGTFRNGTTFSSTGTAVAVSLVVEDFNGDGHADLAVGGITSSGVSNVTILTGNGDGTFTIGAAAPTGTDPVFLVAADLNGDGRADIVTANAESNDLSVLLATSSSPLTISDNSASKAVWLKRCPIRIR